MTRAYSSLGSSRRGDAVTAEALSDPSSSFLPSAPAEGTAKRGRRAAALTTDGERDPPDGATHRELAATT